jgi:hypothetical protein
VECQNGSIFGEDLTVRVEIFDKDNSWVDEVSQTRKIYLARTRKKTVNFTGLIPSQSGLFNEAVGGQVKISCGPCRQYLNIWPNPQPPDEG